MFTREADKSDFGPAIPAGDLDDCGMCLENGPNLFCRRLDRTGSRNAQAKLQRRGLAARNLLFAVAVTGGLISLMLLKENHEKWMRSASGAAVKPVITTAAATTERTSTKLLNDPANVQLIAGTPAEMTKTPPAAVSSAAAKAVVEQTPPTKNRQCQEALDRGKAFLSEGRAGNAVVLLRQAVEHDPQCAEAHYHLGLAYAMQGNVSAARAQRDTLQELNPNLANLLGNLVR